ncbi:sensor histidine kinase [Lachnoanaerobaculum saburreum]|jgi:sensor protein dltS|uniref:histidine kinase n=1 Tax=Lachnoanaerobaculum saburreum DSM 3986 TaxID=887325 RepID=E6LJM2_9FIRM|nr:HAMP domain-containing sensor histidine kinase [Lachnoanaerobaculum saburreum]EFU77973.1 ATPase/histidine kinase/DNA gyrase B/HSP90 domain protein [Lachnoanaerobaculum saburreum DSM 3986]
MIEKLQRKLTLLLSSVSIFLLLFLLIFPFLFNRYNLYSSLKTSLSAAISSPMHVDNTSSSYPVFMMLINSDSEILDSKGPDFFLDDDLKSELISDALSKITDSDKLYSSINKGKLAYLCKKDTPPDSFEDEAKHSNDTDNRFNKADISNDFANSGFKNKPLYRIAVTDFSNEIKSLQRLSVLLTALFFILSSIIILFSRYFVKKSIRPVSDAIISQRRFISDASHELKTPLTVIISNIDNLKKLLSKESFNTSSITLFKKNINGIDEMSIRMKHLTEDLLNLSRLENWQDRKEQMNQIALSDIATKECLYFEPLFFEDSKTLDYTIEENISILGDAGKIKDLISILLENALKYSVSHTNLILNRQKNNIILSIENDIEKELSKEDTVNIFKRFFRLDSSHSGTGYGLGLPIAKEIVLMHKGEIKVSSKGKKVCFLVSFHI